jgi:hypothetical protein
MIDAMLGTRFDMRRSASRNARGSGRGGACRTIRYPSRDSPPFTTVLIAWCMWILRAGRYCDAVRIGQYPARVRHSSVASKTNRALPSTPRVPRHVLHGEAQNTFRSAISASPTSMMTKLQAAVGTMDDSILTFERRFAGKRVVFFEPNHDFATNPTLERLAAALIRCGAEVHLVAPPAGDYPTTELRVRSWSYPEPVGFRRCLSRHAPSAMRQVVSKFLLQRLCRAGFYDLAIGIDPAGIALAHEQVGSSTPCVYLSFEIFFEDELENDSQRELKRRERAASRAAALVIIQDEVRGALLADENNLALGNMLFVPVSPGFQPRAANTRWWHRKYGLGERDVVVLQSGSIAPWSCTQELLASAPYWDSRFVLVLHSRVTGLRTEAVQSGARVIFSDIPAPPSLYDELVASADIGLVLYRAIRDSIYTGKNLQHIGLASGKLAFYMKYGLPVATVDQPSLANLLRTHECGEHLESFEEMPAALRRLVDGREAYSAGARRLFARLSFDTHWPRLAEALSGLLVKR